MDNHRFYSSPPNTPHSSALLRSCEAAKKRLAAGMSCYAKASQRHCCVVLTKQNEGGRRTAAKPYQRLTVEGRSRVGCSASPPPYFF